MPEPQNATPWWAFWKKIPAWVYALLVAFSVVITLLEGYPWLSVEESGFLDPANPYSQLFKIRNGGYIPLTDIDAACKGNVKTMGWTINNGFNVLPVADYLPHDGAVTLTACSQFLEMRNTNETVPAGSTLDIIVTYAYFHLNWKPMRRSQEFHLKSIVGRDGSQHWIFL
jgi:hypothetical protein